MTVTGNMLCVETLKQYELTVPMQKAVHGWFDPDRAFGRVFFTTQDAAQTARRQIEAETGR